MLLGCKIFAVPYVIVFKGKKPLNAKSPLQEPSLILREKSLSKFRYNKNAKRQRRIFLSLRGGMKNEGRTFFPSYRKRSQRMNMLLFKKVAALAIFAQNHILAF
jgi:hypothetical protein